ncbi:hypothetical protein BBJ28_00008199 [Nothophytophthora sp. Chile5]|nr:hypothetical protein BBJ28_00008199 [Nothophytophthora sp. Chile5]
MDNLPSPKTDYVSASDGAGASPKTPQISSTLESLPNEATPYNALETAPRTPSSPCQFLPSRLQQLLRSWMVLRWRLSRSVFSLPLPFLTSNLDVKLGDLVLTLPVVAILVIITAIQAKNRDVTGSGTPPSIAMILLFGFAVRNNSVLLVLTGIPFERALFYHKVFAIVTIILSALHGLSYLLAWHNDEEVGKGGTAVTGIVAFGAMLLMFVLSLNVIRRKFFELFVRTHWILFIVVIGFAVAHGAALALVGIVPWAIDMLFRLVYRTRMYSQGSVLKTKKNEANVNLDANSNVLSNNSRMGVIARDQLSVCALPGNITRISFPRIRKDTGEVFEYEAGQFAFLCIPTISNLQWHPFTISSSPHEDMVTFHVKALGDWTVKLLSAAPKGAAISGDAKSPFDILVDGPYGSISVDLENVSTYSHIVLFSGGIGVTPMRSIVNWLHHEVQNFGRAEIKRVHFVWSVGDREILQALTDDSALQEESAVSSDAYFPHQLSTGSSSGDTFKSEFYLTRGERDVEAQVDQRLDSCLRYGSRPNVNAILRAMGEQAKQNGKQRVAVLVCGPEAMVRDVVNSSLTLSKEMLLQFDVHSERFEF